MNDKRMAQLSRRERQIMEVIFARGAATVAEVQTALAEAPSYSTVRALLRILVDKGHLTHRSEGPRYVYSPVVSVDAARESALRGVVRTFFDGSPSAAVAALLDMSQGRLSDAELSEINGLIRRAKREGR
jgi:BlaI family transcriptional regulator, penicillinase repressor